MNRLAAAKIRHRRFESPPVRCDAVLRRPKSPTSAGGCHWLSHWRLDNFYAGPPAGETTPAVATGGRPNGGVLLWPLLLLLLVPVVDDDDADCCCCCRCDCCGLFARSQSWAKCRWNWVCEGKVNTEILSNLLVCLMLNWNSFSDILYSRSGEHCQQYLLNIHSYQYWEKKIFFSLNF